MLKIGVTGGKGGVGKSTIALLLANKFVNQGKKTVVCDCDVECPNDYLLLSQKLNRVEKVVYQKLPKLDQDKCLKCGLCGRNCYANAIFQPIGKEPVFLDHLCSGCGLCWNICPQKAIGVIKKKIGWVFKNKIKQNFHLVSGKTIGLVEETSPIVSETKQFAISLAEKIKADYLIIDTAVGLHCGVIKALSDLDLAYAVTEPTPLGVHDLSLILDLLRKLKVKSKVIVNQFDQGNINLIKNICQKEKVKIEYQVPYSKELFSAYCRGNLDKVALL